MKRLRVLSVVYNDIRRDSRVFRISDAIAVEHDVTVLSIAPLDASPPPNAAFQLSEITLDHTRGALRTKYAVFWARVLARAIRWRFDVVHCHDIFPAPVAAFIARVQGATLIYDAHELVDHRARPRTLFTKFWEGWHRRMLQRADYVIAPSHARAQFLDAGYGLRRRALPVLNVVEPETGGVDRASARHALGLGSTDVLIVYQGYVSRERHVPALVAAFAHMPPEYRLMVLGEGPAMPDVRREVAAAALEDRVTLTGYVPKAEVVARLRAADCGVVLYDGATLNNYYCAPNKLYDYLGARIPIVCNALPELERVVNRFGVGVVADEPTPQGLAAAIREAVDQEIPDSKFDAALRDDPWPRQVERLLALYRSITVRPEAAE